jgi:four helix bundle protein
MPNDKFPMTNNKKNYDLTKRTSSFGVEIIKFVKTIKENNINKPIINQLVRLATSIGANYMEADCAESKKDFNHKIGICKKESKETTHWLHMLTIAEQEN